ncbi:MAG: DUF4258 domain-containing protein, partial [Gammaproteobacteria bacterium]|nr:DUF4258 domain-containing protein [Gammaproteobacteria bacterium]
LNEIGTDFSKTSVVAERTIAAGIVGGTVASATGGSFMNGAKTAAFAEMFNDEAHLLAEAEKATANFFVGVGDGATFGATAYGRPAGTIDTHSLSYRLGYFFGGGAVAYLGGEGGIALGKMAFSLRTEEVVGEETVINDLNLSNHATQRMAQRGISEEEIQNTMKQDSFQYHHSGEWKTGYYNSESKLFVGQTSEGRITTVMRTRQSYIENLKGLKP